MLFSATVCVIFMPVEIGLPVCITTALSPRLVAAPVRDVFHDLVPLAGIPHIKLPGPKYLNIFDESYICLTHECRQPSHQAHETIRCRRELAFDGQGRWLSLRLHSLRTPPGAHLLFGYLSSPLVTSRIFATLVLDGARPYASTLAAILCGTLPRQQAETAASWHAAPGAAHLDELSLHASQ